MVTDLRVHPRLVQQGLGGSPDTREALAAALPALPFFGGRRAYRIIAVLDWDHRLPGRRIFLRVHAIYDESAFELFERAYAERLGEIKRRNLYPEFDVPDFEELPASEVYDAELTPELGFERMRLVSPWRREVDADVASAAVGAVRESDAFARVRAAEESRPQHLGELEPVAWMPPCESGYEGWTVDVWWLTAFDGRTGRGWSFLVDVDALEPVVTHREFSVRAGG